MQKDFHYYIIYALVHGNCGRRKVIMVSYHSHPDLLTDIIRPCKVIEINHFGSFKDAKQVFDEIAGDHCEQYWDTSHIFARFIFIFKSNA